MYEIMEALFTIAKSYQSKYSSENEYINLYILICAAYQVALVMLDSLGPYKL